MPRSWSAGCHANEGLGAEHPHRLRREAEHSGHLPVTHLPVSVLVVLQSLPTANESSQWCSRTTSRVHHYAKTAYYY